jgi:beta-lactam-binding protein with PASTA domain
VEGKTLAAARSALAKAGCKVGTMKHSYSPKVKQGRVISQKPRSRANLTKGSKVELVVSLGRAKTHTRG